MKRTTVVLFIAVLTAFIVFGFSSIEPASPGVKSKKNEILFVGATYLGGSNADDFYETSIAIGDAEAVVISGFTLSNDFPVTSSSYKSSFNGGRTDRFLSKISNNLDRLTASTFVGSRGFGFGFVSGDGDDIGHAVAIDEKGNVFIAGYTDSESYPVTDGSYDTSFNGGRDAFISKFDSELNVLIASTFIGGTGDEGYLWPRIDMTVNKSGEVIITGITHSVDFPVSSNAFSSRMNGGLRSGDVFVSVFDNDLKKLKASTYLGGSSDEWRVSVSTDADGDIFVCGETESSDFPTTDKAYDRTLNTIKDAFITRFDKDLSKIKASTFYGGSKLDEAIDMKISNDGLVYITGYTESEDIPVTTGSFSKFWNGGNRDGYIAALDTELGSVRYSTLIGGSNVDFPRGITLDDQGNVYITGNTNSQDFPVTSNAYSSDFKGGSSRGDVFLSKFSHDLSGLSYSTLVGGSRDDTGFCIEIDHQGNIFIAGHTSSKDFPGTENSFSKKYNGGINDCFILKFSNDNGKQ